MTKKDLLIMQSIAEFRKMQEMELKKAHYELANDNETLYNYHYGRADGLKLVIDRLVIIEKTK